MIGSLNVALDHADANLLGRLVQVWNSRKARNLERTVRFDGEAALRDFGISLPPQMRNIGALLGWTAKGVRAVTDRSEFDGFVSPSGGEDAFGLDQIQFENRFAVEFGAAKVSSAIHGTSFLTVSEGDTQSGEPEIMMLARTAETSAAIWDPRRRALAGFLSVIDTNDQGQITRGIMWTPEKVLTFTRQQRGYKVEGRPNKIGRTSVAPLVHGFNLGRPLGTSRITGASMYFSDAALRSIVRAEVSSEFYSAPEYWLFGADVSQFAGGDRWNAIMGRIKALDVDPADPKSPQLHRFTGASPQPHTEQLRMWQSLFADDQDLEVQFADSSNPSSADAIFAAKESLITKTRDGNKMWGFGAVQAMQFSVMLRDGLTEVPSEMMRLSAQFTDPAIVSPTARADAYVKLSSVDPAFAASRVGRQYAGLTSEQITLLEAEQRRLASAQLTEALRTAGPNAPTEAGASAGEDELNQANILKAKADALGVLRRAGVEADEAANRVGLPGLKFIPGSPITIKQSDD